MTHIGVQPKLQYNSFIHSFIHSLSSFDMRHNADDITTRIHALYNTIKWIKIHYGFTSICLRNNRVIKLQSAKCARCRLLAIVCHDCDVLGETVVIPLIVEEV